MSISEYCESKGDYQILLDVFTQSYIEMYNKLRVAQRKEIKIYLYRNFSYWFYSNLNPYGDTSPSNFINSDIANKFKHPTMVYPVCEPVYKREKLMDIRYKFHIYSLNNHPFIKDMRTLIHVLRDYLFPDDGFDSLAYQDLFKILNNKTYDFASRETTYIDTLYETCIALKLIYWEDDKQHRLVVNELSYNNFFSLSTKEQLIKVVTTIIERFIKVLAKSKLDKKIPTPKQIYGMLKAGMETEDFIKKIFSSLMQNVSLEELISMFGNFSEDDFDDDFAAEHFEEIYPYLENLENITQASSITHRFFFLPLGQYLQLIHPLYDTRFTHRRDEEHLDLLKQNIEDDNFMPHTTFVIYMTPPDCYKLSPLGIELFRNGRPEKDLLFDSVQCSDYDEVLDDMLNATEEEPLLMDAFDRIFGGRYLNDDLWDDDDLWEDDFDE